MSRKLVLLMLAAGITALLSGAGFWNGAQAWASATAAAQAAGAGSGGAQAQSGGTAGAGQAQGGGEDNRPTNASCAVCHDDPTAVSRFRDKEKVSLNVNPGAFAHSVHGTKLACIDCHTDITASPHPPKRFENRHAMRLAYYEMCKRCHFPEYSRLLDGVHYAAISKGNQKAPTCVDCHGSHEMAKPARPRALISRTCAQCHTKIAAAYLSSVHGKALIEQDNHDVPVCTDCHHAHDNSNPLSASWHLSIPQLCAHCHTNQKMMAKYHISTDVLTTYLADFHGMTASLEQPDKVDRREFTATCTDCHGVHDILRIDGMSSGAIKVNLLAVCQHCHKGASASFPSAWIGHYEPSLRRAPLVYLVKVGYMIFIPFVIGGLVLQILLHLWRVVVNR